MYVLRRTGQERATNIWPGFVDALATLLLVVIFVLMVFVIGQFFLTAAITGKDEQLARLDRRIAELSDLLALERSANQDLQTEIADLSAQLRASLAQREDLKRNLEASQSEVRVLSDTLIQMENQLEQASETIEVNQADLAAAMQELEILRSLNRDLETELKETQDFAVTQEEERATALSQRDEALEQLRRSEDERATALFQRDEALDRLEQSEEERAAAIEASERAERQLQLLNQQILALRQQLAALEEALEASEAENAAAQVQIAELGERLNAALASKVQELARYRSEFFGRLREVLGDNPNIRIVGDRFVFQSEVLFQQGEAEIGPAGREQLQQFAETLRQIISEIPEDIDWLLRVDGHTDNIPISTPRFPSNWELSAARAISVVKFLIDEGIPASRLVAAGFGEFQPLTEGEAPTELRRNRRIEFKLDQR